MKVNGIIAEYNPFHNGHKFHLTKVRELTKADYNIVILSGNFTQRGEPAMCDKFLRARMALENGADLVIELPISHSSASAEYFAHGAVSILNHLGVVDYLCFGSEAGNTDILTKIAKIILEEPSTYVKDLKSALAAGHSYPAARTRALTVYAPELARDESLFSAPNNILGIEYIKALLKSESSIAPITIYRSGEGYHSRRFGEAFCSSLALRQAIIGGYKPDAFAAQMPGNVKTLLADYLSETPPVTIDDFSNMLLYKLIMEQDKGFERFMDVTSELSDRIRNSIKYFESFTGFCNLLKTKNLTYTRIRRCLLHILLDMKVEDRLFYDENETIPFARVLGFRKAAAPLLTVIKEKATIPLIMKLSEAPSQLSSNAMMLLTQDLRRSSIYESIIAQKTGRSARDERQIPMAIID